MLLRIGRLALIAASLACCAHASAAQERCELDRSIAPDYGGVMLGMTLDELRKMFPASLDLRAAKPDGTHSAVLGMLDFNIRAEAFKGVEELTLTLIGGKVQRIGVAFRAPTPWKNVAELAEHASKRLALPADTWGPPVADAAKQARVMDCRGFSVVVRVDREGASSLSIVDTTPGEKDGKSVRPRTGGV
jgi:hypothetical protein